MIKVAICEDSAKTAGIIDQTLHDYADCIMLKIDTEVYGSAEELYADLINGISYDMMFLDIELKQLDGIKLGQMIRNELNNSAVLITIVTVHANLFKEFFDAEPQQLVLKPFSQEDIMEAFKKMHSRYERMVRDCFVYKFGRDYYRVPIKDIIYFRIENRCIHIKTVAKEDFFPGNLVKVEEKLRDSGFFFRANKNYYVNYMHVSRVSTTEVLLFTNETIHLGAGTHKKLLTRQAELHNLKKYT